MHPAWTRAGILRGMEGEEGIPGFWAEENWRVSSGRVKVASGPTPQGCRGTCKPALGPRVSGCSEREVSGGARQLAWRKLCLLALHPISGKTLFPNVGRDI